MNKQLTLTAMAACVFCADHVHSATVPTATVNGNLDQRHSLIALTHANIHVDAKHHLSDATILIQDGRVVRISDNNKVPAHAVIKDYSGRHIYPGFVHLDATVGLPEVPKRKPFSFSGPETMHSSTEGAYNTNEAVKASQDAAKDFNTDPKVNKELRSVGFTTALIHHKDGIFRGTGALVSLNDDAPGLNVIEPSVSTHHSFDKGSSKQDFPVSLMGSVALIRQTWLDADWYQQQSELTDLDLAAIHANQTLPKIISSNNWQQTVLAKKMADEFDTTFVVKTSGDSYQDLDAVAATGQTLVVPLTRPKTPAIKDELDAWAITYKDLKAWEIAPHNPALLAAQGVEFALVPGKSSKTFLKDLRQAHEHGLSETLALASITSIPAQILKQPDLGHLRKGARADFVVTTGPLLDKNTQINETWVAGQQHKINPMPAIQGGEYTLSDGEKSHRFKLKPAKGKFKASALDEEDKNKYEFSIAGDVATLKVSDDESSHTYLGVVNNGTVSPLNAESWSLQLQQAAATKPETAVVAKSAPSIPKPFNAYGLANSQNEDNVVIQNATVWTNEDAGILTDQDVWVQNGKIKQIGDDLEVDGALVIDGEGKHLTSGIIDEHAHIALLSVNDIAVNSSLVRMEDAINSHDVNIYRNLTGGVTAGQLLHGSANPIGGQSALIKYKWGVESPAELLIDGADGFIKFALGENVKRSSNRQSIRYPQTRMGVEQVFRDAFLQARKYEADWAAYNKLSRSAKKKTTPPRRDLTMEATLEVINQDRFVSCHSYVQSEISMLMHVAEDFGFNINTFTHILEGYKVADQMKKHGVGGSTFSDWWSYKWEVNHAIPYNAALMHDAGVVTAINSDSAEMSRRLNQEAAKSMKYGNMSEEDAWKLVTLNPAKLLHLDQRMGSIKAGKDADLVLWSDNPLSIYAKVEKTMVDGVIYFDRDHQTNLEKQIAAEKQRLIKLTKGAKGPKTPMKSMPEPQFECESITGYHQLDHTLGGHQ